VVVIFSGPEHAELIERLVTVRTVRVATLV